VLVDEQSDRLLMSRIDRRLSGKAVSCEATNVVGSTSQSFLVLMQCTRWLIINVLQWRVRPHCQSKILPRVSSGYYSAPDTAAEYRDERVCLSVFVCLFAIISPELHVRSSPNLLRMLPMAVARSSSGGVVICYVLPVLWMTSYLLVSQGCLTSPPS